jgi:hypothetical protein
MRKKQTELSVVQPAPATPETRIIRKQAKLLDQQRKTLGDISLEAIRIATLQLAVRKLEEGLRLLAQAGITREQVAAFAPQAAPVPVAPVVQNPCVNCGRPGVYQSKNKAIPLAKRPWYCAGEHATWAMREDNEEQNVRAVMPALAQTAPSAPPPTIAPSPVAAVATQKPAGLSAAMAALQGQPSDA